MKTKKTMRHPFLIRLFFSILFFSGIISYSTVQAQFNTATVNGTIAASEYGTHTDGNNQQTSGSTITYMTWDATNLYIGVSAATTSEGFVIYFDKDNLTPIDGGTNTNGTNVGNAYDGTNFGQLPFRADIVMYVKTGYREFRTADGIGGWSIATTSFGSYAEAGGTVREFSIPWTSFPGGAKPSAFNWFSYVTSSGGFVYGQIPTANASGTIGTSARYERYYNLTNTATGTSTKPMSRDCFVFNNTADENTFGAISVFDFTMNTTGRQIARTSGTWTIGGTLRVNAGSVYYGSGGSYGPSTAAAGVVSGGLLDMDLNNQTQAFTNTLTLSGGTFNMGNASNNVTVAAAITSSATALLISGGTATLSNGTLSIGASGGGNQALSLTSGTLTLSGATVNLNGNFTKSGGTLTQNAGLLAIDGNSGTAGTSVASGTHLFTITNNTGTSCTAGTIRIVDPPHSSYSISSNRAISMSVGTAPSSYFFSGTHTFEFGDGSSSTVGNADGFVIECFASSFIIPLNNVTVNAGSGTGRWVSAGYSGSAFATAIQGNLTINANGEFRNTLSAEPFYLAGNLTNNGTLTALQKITFAGVSAAGATAAATTAQTISGTGVWRNAVAGSTASFASITTNNTSASGITLGTLSNPLSISGAFVNTAGLIFLGNNDFTFISGATTFTGSSTKMFVTASGSTGALKYVLPTGVTSGTFPVGENTGTTEFSPFSISFSANSTIRTIGVRVVDASHPNIDDIDVQTSFISRYWQLSNSAAGTYTYTGTATYLPADINGTEGSMKMNLWNGASPWKQTASNAASNVLTITTGFTETTGPLSATAEFTGRVKAGTTYTWNQAGTAAYSTAANWTPTRTSPATDDILVFDGTTTPTPTVTGVPTETIGKLLFTNSANVIFQSGAAVTLTISGGSGTDLDIPGGSTLQLASTAANSINIAYTGTQTANIAGTLSLLANTSNNNTYTATNSTTTVTGTINSSGTITSTTANLLFTTGTYNHTFTAAGVTANLPAIPTATWTANTSLCTITGLTNPTAGTFPSGLTSQTFGNFTWNTVSLSTDPNIGGGTITSAGTFTMTSTGSATLRLGTGTNGSIVCTNYSQGGGTVDMAAGVGAGSIKVSGTYNQSGGTITETSSGSGTIEFNGAASQAVTFGGTLSNTINVKVSNPLGIAISGTLAMNNATTFTAAANGTAVTSGTVTYGPTTTLAYVTSLGTQTTGNEFPASSGPVNVTFNNTSASRTITLSGARTVTGTLTLTGGRVTLGANDLTLANGGTLTATSPSATNMIVTDAAGLFKRGIPATTGTYLFPIGEITGTTQYSPVSLQFTANSAIRIIGAKVIDAASSNLNTGGTPTNYLTRYWTFSENGAGGTYNYYINPAVAITGAEDEAGTAASIKAAYWNGSAWTQSTGTYSSGSLVSNATGVSEAAASLNTVEWTGRENPPLTYTWNGVTSNDWNTAINWTPNGIPNGSDIVTIDDATNNPCSINSGSFSVGTLTISSTGDFRMAAATSLTVAGDVTYTSSVAPTLNCTSTITFSKVGSLTIPAWNYGSLTNANSTTRTWTGSATTGICGTFTPGTSTTYTATSGSTVDYSGSGSQTTQAVNYFNLTNSGNGARTLASATITIAGSYTPTTATITPGTSTVDFSSSGAQTIPAALYYNISNSGNGNRTLANGGTINLSGPTFSAGSGAYTVTNNTWVYSYSGAGSLSTSTYNNLQFTGSVGDWNISSGNTITVLGDFTQSAGYFAVNNSSSGTSTLNISGACNISGVEFDVAFFNGIGNLTVTGLTTVNGSSLFYVLNGTSSTVSQTVNLNGGLTISAAGGVNLEPVGSTSGVATINVIGNFTATSTSLAIVDFGLGTVTNNAINITGNFSKSGAGTFDVGSTGQPTGFVFNGSGTSASPQTFSYSGAASTYHNYKVNSGTYVKLLTGLALGTASNPASTLAINGSLDCQTFVVSGSTTAGVNLASGATLITANTGGVASSITATTPTFTAGAKYEFNSTTANQSTGFTGLTIGNPNMITVSNTFGTVTPDVNVTFGNSATLKVNTGAILVAAAARTFTFGTSGTANIDGTVRTANLTATGALSGSATSTIVSTNTPTINLNTGSTVEFNGASAQFAAARTFSNINVNNSNGVTLTGDITANGTLTFTSGKITTGSNKVIISATGAVSGGGTGWVIGNLQKNVATGSPTRTFELGDASFYHPVQVDFASVSVAGDLLAKVSQANALYSPLTGSGLHATNNLRRFFTLTNSGITFTNYDATFTFVAGDAVGTTTNYVVRKYNGSTWAAPASSVATATTTKGTAFTGFSDFVMGEANSLVAGNNPSDAGICAGTNTSFTTTASASDPTPTIKWQRSTDGIAAYVDITAGLDAGTTYSGFTSTTLVLTGSTAGLNNYHYRAVFTNINGAVNTTAATLTVTATPTSFAGANTSICTGAVHTLSDATIGGGASTGTWSITGVTGTMTNATSQLSDITATATPATVTFTPIAGHSGTVTLTLTTNAPGACSAATSSVTLTIDGYVWSGGTSSTWSDAANWSGCGVPVSGGDITIATTTFDPTLPGDFTVGALIINSGKILAIGANTLTVNTGISGAGRLVGSSTSNLVLAGGTSTLLFDQSTEANLSLGNLTLNSGASATLGDPMDVWGTIQLTSATLNLNAKHLTLKSTSANTARIGNLTGSTLSNATNVTMERYIKLRTPGTGDGTGNYGRAYRLLTPTVNTSGSINANWQEGQMVSTIGTPVNTMPGYGTHITGSGGNANGFDRTQTNAASLYLTTNGTTLSYNAVTSTAGTLDAKTGYFLYLRGDRSMDLQVPLGPNMPTSSTTLRATGTVLTGDQTTFANALQSGAGTLNLVTNPYPSPIDWALVYGDATHITDAYTYWDPNLGTRGGFATVNTVGGTSTAESGTVGGTQYIQSGQAFFVQSADATTPTVTIKESHKAAGNNNGVFKTTSTLESFRTTLYFIEPSGYRRASDGALAIFDNSYSAALDQHDAFEINNWDENIAIAREGKHIAIESRPVIQSKDTIPLFMNNMKQQGYQFEFVPSLFTNPALKAELIDKFLGTRTLISVVDTARVSFSITSDPASSATDRFMVVFGPPAALAIDVMTIKAYQKNAGAQVEWTAKTETNMDHYEVERSFDGVLFNKQSTTMAVGNSSIAVSYSWYDGGAQLGNNFYRVKAFDKSGQIKYTSIVKVTLSKGQPAILVYPNPVQGNNFSLQLTNMDKGTYTMIMYNNLGQKVFSTQLQHAGGTATKTIAVDNALMKGTYQLVLVGENGDKLSSRIIKN